MHILLCVYRMADKSILPEYLYSQADKLKSKHELLREKAKAEETEILRMTEEKM